MTLTPPELPPGPSPTDALPSLDAHGHLDLRHPSEDLASCGAVLAMTLSPDEAALAAARREPWIAWGIGCHPRIARAHQGFDAGRLRDLAQASATVSVGRSGEEEACWHWWRPAGHRFGQ